VQTCCPQIYLACHTRHVRAASSAHRLSSRDWSLLAHLGERRATPPSVLARHLSVNASTMSAAVKRLERLGYVARERETADGRRVTLRLTGKGARAMKAASVLDADCGRRVLARLSRVDRRAALDGFALLARASTPAMREAPRA
jgi:MarR family transcriptional regulator, organic hydroperoxide resistance regulator